MKKLVIVESPTKARTIKKFLGADYFVESCMGHVRDLPQSAKDIPEAYKKQAWSKLGVNVDAGFDPLYCIPKGKGKIIKELKKLLKEADELILATDEDREGESISWHLLELLKPKVPVKRMVFHEITKSAINKALKDFRDIDDNLVRAQESRRVLDRLMGYTISPLLWKKVAFGLSAGRVQSVAVKILSDKEKERLRFLPVSYWGAEGSFQARGESFSATLSALNKKEVAVSKDFGQKAELLNAKKLHLKETPAKDFVKQYSEKNWTVKSLEKKPTTRKAPAPFITSTLQQAASGKLKISIKEVMMAAQKLYERGFITYMRTDSTFLSDQAIKASRSSIEENFGKKYLADSPRRYDSKKVKGAQEAHEAIRPAGDKFLNPDQSGLRALSLELYRLIWARTLASQMSESKHQQVKMILQANDAEMTCRGYTTEFMGFLKAYSDDSSHSDVYLPELKQGEEVKCLSLDSSCTETKAPQRYSEASLVKLMEKEGVGRPSTYASIISTIIYRGYVKKVGNALVPTLTALVVAKVFDEHFPKYVDLQFTSQMESSLDKIAEGKLVWKDYLAGVYLGKEGLKEVISSKEETIDPKSSRSIKINKFPNYEFKVGRYGAYVCTQKDGEEICASLTDDFLPGNTDLEYLDNLIHTKINGADSVGKDPETGKPLYILSGRYGPYVQLGEADEEAGEKPKRVSIPAHLDANNLSFDKVLYLSRLPLTMGVDEGSGKNIIKHIGRFGPYVVLDGDFRSIPKTEDFFDFNLDKAKALLAQPKKGRGSKILKSLGKYEEASVDLFDGRYGPYLKWNKYNVSLGESYTQDNITLKVAIDLIQEKIDKSPQKKKKVTKKTVTKKKASTKVGIKKKAAKKKVAKKKVSKAPAAVATKVILRKK
ncbi:MAG: type I DNA topoisomerase [Bdellovibrionaceae bacterium]|nr:type I DNA topoisomerase [Pseudobdellovibrionaceae bacterium]